MKLQDQRQQERQLLSSCTVSATRLHVMQWNSRLLQPNCSLQNCCAQLMQLSTCLAMLTIGI
jgi:hypothetical protein